MGLTVLFLTILLAVHHEADCQENSEDNHCPSNYECVPYSKCKNLAQTTMVYPCIIGNVNMLCCPTSTSAKPAVVQRSAAFPNDCGVYSLDDRIIGGKNSDLGEFPFMALLGLKLKNIPFSLQCGGSIVSKRYILTAAHCFDGPRPNTVRLGEHNLTSDVDCVDYGGDEPTCADPHVDLEIEKIIVHQGFNPNNLKNDIALVKVKKDITFSDFIQPICLPFGKQLQTKSLKDTKLEVAGWGKTKSAEPASSILQYAKVSVWDIFRCNSAVPPEVQPIQNTQLCAKGKEAEGACTGDSGGPLFNRTIEGNKGITYQIGVVSFAARNTCKNREAPGVYTRIDGFLQWIVDNVK